MSLLEVALLFVRMGAMSFGGGYAILAELQRELVDHRALMTASEFAIAFALGQATPGPAILYLIPLGHRVAGPAGAAVALVSFLLPPLLLQLVIASQWGRLSRTAWFRALTRSLVPLSLGLIASSLYTLAGPLTAQPASAVGLVVAAAVAVRFRVTPAVIVIGAGVAGLFGLV